MKIIGHRGARALAPENTLAAIAEALKYPVDEIEFDIRVTKDGIIILNHGTTILGTDGNKYSVSKYTYSQLKRIKPDVALFFDAMNYINHTVPTYIEVKGGVKVEPIISAIKKLMKTGWDVSDFLLGSKSQATLLQLHHALPNVQLIVIEPISGFRAIKRARQVSSNRLSLNQMWFWPVLVRYLHKQGLEVYLYTVNKPKSVEKWKKRGVAGIVTDHPDKFLSPKK